MPNTSGNEGDTAIPIQVQLFRGDTPYNASGIALANIRFRFKIGDDLIEEVPADGADDAVLGKFWVTPPAKVRNIPRQYTITVHVTEADGKTQTFPEGVENRYTHRIRNA